MDKKQFAFTLIELLVVIAIIGILSGLIVVTMNGVTAKANIAKSQMFSNSLRNALMLNLISEWKFDDLSVAVEGSIIRDSWSGGNNGTLYTNSDGLNKVKLESECISGKCLSFDASGDYISVLGSDSASNNLAITGAITLSVWAKFDDLGIDRVIMGRGRPWGGNSDSGYSLARYNSDNIIDFYTYSTTLGDRLRCSSAITDQNWHYIVGTWDGTVNTNGKKIYVDGVLNNQKTSSISAMGQPSYTFRIGTGGTGFPFKGLIDEARVFSAAMPASQIKEQYYAGLTSLFSKNQITVAEYLERMGGLGLNWARVEKK